MNLRCDCETRVDLLRPCLLCSGENPELTSELGPESTVFFGRAVKRKLYNFIC